MWPALILLLSASNGIWLDVPFIRQPKDGCGSASIWMVTEYWRPRTSASIEEIHSAVFSADAGGVYARDMEGYFSTHGFRPQAFVGEWEEIEEHLKGGRPLIVSLESNARGTPFHYVVVAGLDSEQNLIFVNDPADRKLRTLHRADFESRWKATGNWTLLAVPDGPSPEPVPADPKTEIHETPDLIRASEAFRREDYSEAKRYATQVLRSDPANANANELLATIFFLRDNLEAALKYWNRVNKPAIREVGVDPPVRMDPARLDREFRFARGSVLKLEDYRRTVRQLDATGAFTSYTFDLHPTDSDDFDLTFRSNDRSGANYISWFAGLPFQTIRPRLTNIRGRGVNVDSEIRWDRRKQKGQFSVSSPFGQSASTRFSASAGARNEEWVSGAGTASLKRVEGGAGLHFVVGSRGSWSSEVLAARSEWSTLRPTSSIRYRTTTDYDVLRLPEYRLILTAGIRAEAGRQFPVARFVKGEPSLKLHWFPKASTYEYETSIRISVGRMTSNLPRDEMFSLGLDRDGALPLRAHPATMDGRKGAGLIASRYFLLNAETERTIYNLPLVRFSLAPFIDVARFGTWFEDVGTELRISVASALHFSFSFGKDLQTGRTAIFAGNSR